MDVKLESLIERIKKEGIDEVKKSAKVIIDQAKENAKAIVDEAKTLAKHVVQEAEIEAKRLQNNTESSLRQAARDLKLKIKEELILLFDKVLKSKISKDLSPDFMKEIILKVVDNLMAKEGQIEILSSREDKQKLEKLLLLGLKQEIKKTVIISAGKDIEKGFRIGIKGDSAYYDFSDEAISESLEVFLNPAIVSMLNSPDG